MFVYQFVITKLPFITNQKPISDQLLIAIIVLVGLKLIVLSDSVILALIGSTTVNITTFFLVVTKYLFPSGKLES
ncbi:MAG: hypothetical protein EAY79_09710 [Runella slithyformis]|nr:MAG: hypothetical protein EAY79_09710 [Runella slithyformis]